MYHARFTTNTQYDTHILCTCCHYPKVTQGRYDHLKSKALRITCHGCGEEIAKRETLRKQSRVLPINKSTPTYISDPEMLKQLNPKRTT
jgi:hypothetical protein